MAFTFDKWLFLKVIEFLLVLSCLITKAVTDDEEERLFLYLQKLSKEWPLLNSITWNQVGSAVAWAVYGGYLIIVAGLAVGRATKELPTRVRIMERFLLGIGSILFIVLGGLELIALESIPPDLIDNAAVLGTLSVLVGFLFILDMAAPQLKQAIKQTQTSPHLQLTPLDLASGENGIGNGHRKETVINGNAINDKPNGKKKEMNNNKPRKFDIYGSDRDEPDVAELPVQMEKHSPVFSKIRRPHFGQFDNLSPSYLRFPAEEPEAPPSTPGEPGYVQYTAKRWGQPANRPPRSSPASPTQV